MSKMIDFAQYSDEWWAFRNGKPSASNAKKLITSTGTASKSAADYSTYLAGCLYAGKDIDPFEGNRHTERGTDLEAEARAFYVMLKGVDVQEVGSFTDESEQYIASPDGVVGTGLIEIKVLKPTNHINALIYHNKNKRPPPLYIPQCQMSLLISEQEYIDLMFYCPGLPDLIVRLYAEEKLQLALSTQLAACIEARDKTLDLLENWR